MEFLLGVDLGTTAIKIALFDSNGNCEYVSTSEYSLITSAPDMVEIETETYWNTFKLGLREVCEETKVDMKKIRGISFSAQSETLILLGKNGRPLRNAIVWLDNRAKKEAKIINSDFDLSTVFEKTGQIEIAPGWPASKILWVRMHERSNFSKISKILLIEDYFIYRLTGKYISEASISSSTVYMDIRNKMWWKEMLEYLGINENQLPEIYESGIPVSNLRTDVAKELGLLSNTIVCTGAMDQAAGAVGVGNIERGIFSESTGAALAMVTTIGNSMIDTKGLVPCLCHGIRDLYIVMSFTTGGIVLKWFKDSFYVPNLWLDGNRENSSYSVMENEVNKINPGCDGLLMLPYLSGAISPDIAPSVNPKARGVYYGFTLHHSASHFARAILESIGYVIKHNIDIMKMIGIEVKEIRSHGGGSRSDVWNQIKADITGCVVNTMANENAGCLGAAIMAGVGVGLFSNVRAACKRMIKIKKSYQPNSTNWNIYSENFRRFNTLFNSLTEMFGSDKY